MKRGKNFYLYKIWSLINSGKTQPEIEKELNFSKQRLKYYRDDLKTLKYIESPSYGVWKITKKYDKKEVENFLKEVKKITRIGTNQLEEVKIKKEVRGHAIQIKLDLPEDYRNWHNRRKIFDYLGMEWKPHYIGGIERGELMILDGIKIHFYHKSIHFHFDEKSFFEETSKKSRSLALVKFLKLVKKLERTFNNSPMSQYGKYKFKITRQHYALIKNALARQYINKDKKLHCYTGRGLWLLIDNSFNLEELETVHPETAVEDNEQVQTFFNEGIKKASVETIKETTPNEIKKTFIESGKQIKILAENQQKMGKDIGKFGQELTRHIPAYEGMGRYVKELKDDQKIFFKKLIEEISKINK